MKYILPLIFLLVLLGTQVTYAQYTETINSNHPGQSQGGFSVGNNVLQFEGGLGLGRERHKLLNTKSSAFGLNYAIRYGLFFEALELNFTGNYLGQNVTETFNSGDEAQFGLSGFPTNTLGLKYVVWDPWKRKKEEKPNLKSWRENHRFKWKYLIPAISAYAGANFVFSSSPYRFEEEPALSPRFAIITQSDWKDRWVLVSNIVIDKITTAFPSYEFLLTLTHTLNNPKWAVFGEYQGIKGDFHSDIIARGGAAYLINKDFQVEAELMTSFKNTPSKFYFNLGASYRLDWHKKDEIIRDKDEESEKSKEDSEIEGLDRELEELNREIEELENIDQKPKSSKTNRSFESFEDPEDLEALERAKEENRSQFVEEHQLEMKEKQDKVDEKLSKKDAKREAKLQKKLEKEQLKAQKQTDKELRKLEKKQGALEENEKTSDTTPTNGSPIEEVKPIKKTKKKEKKKKKKRIKRKKLSEEEKEKELDDLDKQIKELEIDFESDRKKKKKPKKKKEKKAKKVKEKKRTKKAETETEEP